MLKETEKQLKKIFFFKVGGGEQIHLCYIKDLAEGVESTKQICVHSSPT